MICMLRVIAQCVVDCVNINADVASMFFLMTSVENLIHWLSPVGPTFTFLVAEQ